MKIASKHIVVMVAAVIALGAVAFFAWTRFLPASRQPEWADTPGNGIVNSSQQVSASIAMHDQTAEVTLHIRAGWHVNAHPASLDYLIPTTVMAERDGSLREVPASYPPGKQSGIIIDGKNIEVYEDGTVIPISGSAGLKGSRIVVRAQACNTEGVCLPPANIPASTAGA